MNLKLWSIVMVVSMCLVFLAPTLSMNASAFSEGDGRLSNPYVVTTVWELQNVTNDLSAHYILGNDIDATITYSWNGGEGFVPIAQGFHGSFNGDGHVITNLTINLPSTTYVGLFAHAQNGALIHSVGLEGVNFVGNIFVGGIVGLLTTGSKIYSSYSTGEILANTQLGGGLVGRAYNGYIDDCYSQCNVSGAYIGGLVGELSSSAYINKSYSTGSVSGTGLVGGLVGSISTSVVNASFYDTTTSGQSDTGKGTPKTTEQMRNISTFSGAGWSIVDVMSYDNETWYIEDEVDYPRLSWEEYDYPPISALYLNLKALLPLIIILALFMAFVGALTFKSNYMGRF